MADTARIHDALALVRRGQGFAAHEEFEELWRAAAPEERDLYQGLVHVAVATYQDGRGNAVGRTRQLEKALRRLAPYAPSYQGLDVEQLLAWSRASLAAAKCAPLPALQAPASNRPRAPWRRAR
jgi:predicted metal-dependent hydrolase